MTPLKRLLTGSTTPVIYREPVSFTIFFAGAAYSFTIPAVLWYVGTTLVTSWALKALTPKPDFSGTRGLLTNNLDGTAAQQYVYGRVRKGGTITFYESTGTDNLYLHMIICLAGHRVQSIGDIYINDTVVTLNGSGFVTSAPWNSKIRIKKYTGTDSQTADPDLIAETSADSTFRGRGIAYLYARLEFDQDVFTNGIPSITAVVDGKRVYDPRTATTVFSQNAALCIRDYIVDERGLDDSGVDNTMIIASANVCDEAVALSGGGTESRYQINGVISSDVAPGDNLQSMLTGCAGTLFWGQGAWKLKVGYYTPPVKTFTLDDLRGPVTIQTRTSMSDIFNAVQGTFNDASQDYVTVDFPRVSSSVFLAEDKNVESALDLELPFTTSSSAAQRIAKLTLFRGREQMVISADFGLTALDVQVGDIVALTIGRYGWSSKEFEVIGWKFYQDQESNEIRISMSLRETSSAAFDWNAEEEQILSNNSNLPNAWSVPGVGVSVTSETRIIYEKMTNVILVEVTASTTSATMIERVEVQVKKSSVTRWDVIGVGSLGRFEAIDVSDDFYDIRVRAYNQFGVRGSWILYEQFKVTGTDDNPDNVSSFHGQLNGGTISLEWAPVSNLDLSHYKIRYALESSGATYANATTAIDKVPRPGSTITVPARPGTYMIRAVDKTGNSSTDYTSLVIPEAAFETFANTQTLTDSPTFSGTKSNCSVVSGALRLTTGTSGTYTMSAAIDTLSPRRVRARLDVNVLRYDPNLGLFDSITGLFDSVSGLFDDFTGGSNVADTDVLLYIAISQDGTNFGSYELFKGGDFYGRSFRFRVGLLSETSGVTPSITGLTARVWYN